MHEKKHEAVGLDRDTVALEYWRDWFGGAGRSLIGVVFKWGVLDVCRQVHELKAIAVEI